MKWSYVNGDAITLPPEIVKNNRSHTFPVGPEAARLLETVPRFESPYIFPAARGELVFCGWARCKTRLDKACGVYGWTLHDLRRTMSTKMAEMGIAPHIIERLLNHISGGTLSPIAQIYNRATYMPEMREAVSKWEARLTALLA